MAKQRYINTKFWTDSWVVNRDMVERYLFIYFLTNPHTNIAGIYELPLKIMSFETGLERDHLEKILPRFKGKVYYFNIKNKANGETNGWVYIKNFAKHQAVNESVKKGIDAARKEIPTEVLDKIKEIDSGIESCDTL